MAFRRQARYKMLKGSERGVAQKQTERLISLSDGRCAGEFHPDHDMSRVNQVNQAKHPILLAVWLAPDSCNGRPGNDDRMELDPARSSSGLPLSSMTLQYSAQPLQAAESNLLQIVHCHFGGRVRSIAMI